MTPSDILYILFKHKWKIIFFSVCGFIAAGVVFKIRPGPLQPQYRSEARLFIRYVQENRGPSADLSEETEVRRGGDEVMNNEISILTSLDLAKETARAIGPETILGPEAANNADSETTAGQIIQGGLSAYAPPKNASVLTLTFTNTDPSILQQVLGQHIQSYLTKHIEIHQGPGLYDTFLTQETDQLRSRLAETEAALRQIKEKAGIVSLEQSKEVYASQLSSIQSGIMNSQTELAERKAILAELVGERTALLSNLSENQPNAGQSVESGPQVPEEALQEYERLSLLVNRLKLREKETLIQYREESSTVKNLRNLIAVQAAKIEEMEGKYPELVEVSPTLASSANSVPNIPSSPIQEARQIRAIESRIRILQQQLVDTRTAAIGLSEIEAQIVELERQKQMQEERYRNFSSSLEMARIEEAIGSNRISNISVVQQPSPPSEEKGKLNKILLMLAGGGIGAGLALAFGLEMFVNQTLRRPVEVEGALGLPLFFSIPRLRRGKKTRTKGPSKSTALALSDLGDGIGPWDRHPELKPVCDSLRDRLIFNFEARDLTRKPKLVGITGCGEDSGVSTIAAGLAASLSETGEGNVLLVDMKPGENTPHHFRQGSLQIGLDEALELEKRDDAKAGEHLFVVSESGGKNGDAKGMLPTRFTSLVPKMKASDFDYIIFDMPPITHNSVATSLARYMDTTLMVVESEKTNRSTVKKAGEMLAATGVEFGVVLNKNKEYVPKFIQEGLLGGE